MKSLVFLSLLCAAPAFAEEEAAAQEVNWVSFAEQSATFLIFVGGLVYYMRKPMRSFFASRHEAVKHAVEEAQKAKADAEAKFAEYQKKMNALDQELADLRETMKRSAESERARMVSDAEDAKRRIERDTEAVIAMELDRARQALNIEAADLAVKMAQDILRREIKPEDQKRLANEFASELVNGSASKSSHKEAA